MADKTGIEWTEATWNPIVGCSVVSPGCTNCYAMKQAARIEKMTPQSHYAGTTQQTKGGPVWTGKIKLAPKHIIDQPLRWTRPRLIFVNSMGDLFHEDVPFCTINHIFAVMALCPQHTFQVLTKRADRMREFCSWPSRKLEISDAMRSRQDGSQQCTYPLPNVWLGVSAEDQKRADERLPELVATPAAKRFVSAEPLLGPVDLSPWLAVEQLQLSVGPHWTERNYEVSKLDWVIVGGESQKGARPMHPDWARSLRDQCKAAAVPFFFKQWGEYLHRSMIGGGGPYPEGFHRVGKRAAGSLLDGREHKAMPA